MYHGLCGEGEIGEKKNWRALRAEDRERSDGYVGTDRNACATEKNAGT
jgi:hypothetical protein